MGFTDRLHWKTQLSLCCLVVGVPGLLQLSTTEALRQLVCILCQCWRPKSKVSQGHVPPGPAPSFCWFAGILDGPWLVEASSFHLHEVLSLCMYVCACIAPFYRMPVVLD